MRKNQSVLIKSQINNLKQQVTLFCGFKDEKIIYHFYHLRNNRPFIVSAFSKTTNAEKRRHIQKIKYKNRKL